MENAPVARRLIALITDAIVALLLCAPPAFLWMESTTGPHETAIYWTLYLVCFTFSLTEVVTRRSPGKWLWGLQIVGSRKMPGFIRRALRSIVKLLPGHFLVIWGGLELQFPRGLRLSHNTELILSLMPILYLGYSAMQALFTRRTVAFHDLVAGTEVITKVREPRGFAVIPLMNAHGQPSTAAHATHKAA
jgi:hypothetical protein